jgi:hypothetical protein
MAMKLLGTGWGDTGKTLESCSKPLQDSINAASSHLKSLQVTQSHLNLHNTMILIIFYLAVDSCTTLDK